MSETVKKVNSFLELIEVLRNEIRTIRTLRQEAFDRNKVLVEEINKDI